jgi:hypothetical protein
MNIKVLFQTVSYSTLKKLGYRNAIEALTSTRGLSKEEDTLALHKSFEEILNYIEQSKTINLAINEIKKNCNIKGSELGEILST